MKISLRQLRTIIQEELEKEVKNRTLRFSDEEKFRGNKDKILDRFAMSLAEQPELLEKFQVLQDELRDLSNKADTKNPGKKIVPLEPGKGVGPPVTGMTADKFAAGVRRAAHLFDNPNPIYSSPNTEEEDNKTMNRIKAAIVSAGLSSLGVMEMIISTVSSNQQEFEASMQAIASGALVLGVSEIYHFISDLIKKAEEKKSLHYVEK